MNSKLTFDWRYFVMAVLIFGIEVIIARYVQDAFIRPYFGDFLVVILIYCFVRSFLNTPYLSTAIAVLIFSFSIEMLQYFQVVNRIGLEDSKLARTVIGTSFEWKDLVAYTFGIAVVIYVEYKCTGKEGSGIIG